MYGGNAMFENTRTNKWVVIAFFTAITVFFLYFIVFLIWGSPDPYYARWMNQPSPGDAQSGLANEPATGLNLPSQLILPRDKSVAAGALRIIYRGKREGELRLEVISAVLDPQYAYTRRIPIQSAKAGFRLFDQQFKLLSINRRNLRLEHITP